MKRFLPCLVLILIIEEELVLRKTKRSILQQTHSQKGEGFVRTRVRGARIVPYSRMSFSSITQYRGRKKINDGDVQVLLPSIEFISFREELMGKGWGGVRFQGAQRSSVFGGCCGVLTSESTCP